MELKRVQIVERDGYQVFVDEGDPTSVFFQDMDGNLMRFDAGNHEYHDLYDQVAVAFEHRDEWEEVPVIPVVAATIPVQNPWSGEMVEIRETEVTQEKLDFLATLMDDNIREAIHNSGDCPETPGAFFRRYAEIVGAKEAGRLWFA